jgi:tetratricopeptide (TPR) repeat protein
LLCGTVFHESFRAFGFTITTTKKISDKDLLQSAIKYASNGDYQSAQSNLDKVLSQNPQNVDATQLLGVVKYQQGQTSEALQLLQRALDLDRYQNLGIVANYIEILRASGNLQLASDAGHKALASIDPSRFPDCKVIFFNLAVVEMNLGHSEVAVGLYERALDIDPYLLKAWHYVAEVKAKSAPAEAESVLLKALTFFPDDHTLHFLLGTVYQMQHRLVEALQSYLVAEKLDDQAYNLKGNIASVLQSLGRAEEALVYYQRALPHCTDDAGLYNNYGALLGIMGKYDEELRWLTKALEINPFLGPALVNLAGYYQDEGDLGKARELIKRAAAPEAVYSNGARTAGSLFRIREALMLSPVAATWEQMLSERTSIMRCLQALVDEATRGPAPEKVDVDTSLDRIHFYVSYHGLNDRALQDLVMRLYHLHLRIQYRSPHVLPLAQAGFPGWIQPTASALPSPTLTPPSPVLPSAAQMSLVSLPLPRRARIGFLSKFFGIFEPHGMLLDGVMRYLPRDRFEVLALPVARGDGKPLSPAIASSCDAVHQVSLSYEHAQQMLQELRLDVLVFADTVSEPMTHFLAHSRLAPIQVIFLTAGLSFSSFAHQSVRVFMFIRWSSGAIRSRRGRTRSTTSSPQTSWSTRTAPACPSRTSRTPSRWC